MRIAAILVLISLLASACAAPTGAGGGWTRAPLADEIIRYYPPAALAAGIEGQTVIECLVDDDGHLHTCAVVEESPPGHGFGDASLRLATNFRMAPTTRDGVPTAGGRVRVPIRFNLPD